MRFNLYALVSVVLAIAAGANPEESTAPTSLESRTDSSGLRREWRKRDAPGPSDAGHNVTENCDCDEDEKRRREHEHQNSSSGSSGYYSGSSNSATSTESSASRSTSSTGYSSGSSSTDTSGSSGNSDHSGSESKSESTGHGSGESKHKKHHHHSSAGESVTAIAGEHPHAAPKPDSPGKDSDSRSSTEIYTATRKTSSNSHGQNWSSEAEALCDRCARGPSKPCSKNIKKGYLSLVTLKEKERKIEGYFAKTMAPDGKYTMCENKDEALMVSYEHELVETSLVNMYAMNSETKSEYPAVGCAIGTGSSLQMDHGRGDFCNFVGGYADEPGQARYTRNSFSDYKKTPRLSESGIFKVTKSSEEKCNPVSVKWFNDETEGSVREMSVCKVDSGLIAAADKEVYQRTFGECKWMKIEFVEVTETEKL